QTREQPLDIDFAQGEPVAAAKAAGKQCEKLGQLLAEAGNLLQRHPDDPPWYSSMETENAEDRLFSPQPTQAQLPVPAAFTYHSFQESGAVQLGGSSGFWVFLLRNWRTSLAIVFRLRWKVGRGLPCKRASL